MENLSSGKGLFEFYMKSYPKHFSSSKLSLADVYVIEEWMKENLGMRNTMRWQPTYYDGNFTGWWIFNEEDYLMLTLKFK